LSRTHQSSEFASRRAARVDLRPLDARASLTYFGDVVVDAGARTVMRRGEPVSLTAMEFNLLLALLRRRGAVASRRDLLEEVWGGNIAHASRTVDAHVYKLRRKLEADPAVPRHILTVQKAGYRLQV
jgi:two-component system response regulator MtrA